MTATDTKFVKGIGKRFAQSEIRIQLRTKTGMKETFISRSELSRLDRIAKSMMTTRSKILRAGM